MRNLDFEGVATLLCLLLLVLGLIYGIGSKSIGHWGACVEKAVSDGECTHPQHRLVLEPGRQVCRCPEGR